MTSLSPLRLARQQTWLGLCLWMALGPFLVGCGYSSGVRLPLGARSVGVEAFGNVGPFPEVEREVFAILSTQASRMIDGDVVPPGQADLLICGQIEDYRRLHGVQSAEGSLQESGVRIMLRAWLEDSREGQQIGQVLYYDQSVRYILGVREGEAGARRAALDQLCQEVILDLFNQPDLGRPSEEDPDPNFPGAQGPPDDPNDSFRDEIFE